MADKCRRVTGGDLKLTEEKLQNLFNYATDGIVIVDPITGRFLDCNVNAHKRLGYEKGEFLKLTVADLHHDLSYEDIQKIFQKQILGKSMRIESVHTRKDRTHMPVEITSTLIKVGEQEVLQSFIRDISERKKAEKEKEELIAQLKKALGEIKTLQGILPLCTFCKKIRDDKGFWEQVDVYIRDHTQARISHGLCPDCAKEHYAEFYAELKRD